MHTYLQRCADCGQPARATAAADVLWGRGLVTLPVTTGIAWRASIRSAVSLRGIRSFRRPSSARPRRSWASFQPH